MNLACPGLIKTYATYRLIMNPDFPFRPARLPFFYGWIILILSAIGILMSLPGQTMGVGIFTDDFLAVSGLSRFQLSIAYMVGTVSSALCLPRVGRLYDSLGSRTMAPVVGLLLGLVLCLTTLLERVSSLATEYLNDSLLLVPFCFIALCFFALRFLGQGTLTLVSKNMTLKWFVKKKGFANGLLGIAISFGFSMGVVGMNALRTTAGMNGALFIIAAIVGVLFPILAIVLFRDTPEECDLAPDGSPPASQADNKYSIDGYTAAEAKGTYVFWCFSMGLALIALLHTAISFHVVSIFELADVARDDAVTLFFHMAIVSTLVTIVAGYLSDRFPLKYLLAAMGASMLLTCYILTVLDGGVSRYLLALGMGVGQGCFSILSSVTWPHFFGLTHLGAITGSVMSIMVIGSALGPILYGASEHFSGNYVLANMLCLIAAGALLLSVKKAELKEE
jgi:sugar phosphate permease